MRILYTLLFTGFCFLLFSSCNGNKKRSSAGQIPLQGKFIMLDDEFTASPGNEVIGDYFIARLPSENLLYVGKISNDSITTVGRYLNKGQGPEEFCELSFTNVGDSALLAFNSANSFPLSISMISIDSLILGKRIEKIMIPQQDESDYFRGGYFSSTPIDDKNILMIAGWMERGNIFTLFNTKELTAVPLDWLPDDGFNGSPIVKASVYMDNSTLLSARDRICYISGNGKVAIIFKLQNGQLVPITTIFNEYPDYWADSDGVNYHQHFTTDRMRADGNEDYIYILQCRYNMDRNLATDDSVPRIFGNIVEVFDWDGNLVKTFELDHLVYTIFVSSDNRSLFGLSLNQESGEYIVYQFPIPN